MRGGKNNLMNTNFLQSAYVNDATYIDYLDRLILMATSIFEWVNLPPSCDARFMEQVLCYFGKAIFFKDDQLGYLNLQVVPSGKLNVYNLPVSYRAYSTGYTSTKRLDATNSVLIMNNYKMRPTLWTLQLYAKRLYEVERTIDVNVKAQKTPILINCDENQRLTLKNLYMQYDGNQPFIFADKKAFDPESLTVLKTDAPYIGDKLQIYKHEIWNECLTFLGIDNANTDKKERLITDEVESNQEFINTNLEIMFLTRKQAVKKINEIFGLNVDVKIRDDIKLIDENLRNKFNNDTEEGGENE